MTKEELLKLKNKTDEEIDYLASDANIKQKEVRQESKMGVNKQKVRSKESGVIDKKQFIDENKN